MINGDAEAFAGPLINDVQCAKRPAIRQSIDQEIIAPYMIFPLGKKPDAGTIIEPEPSSLRLLLRHGETFLTPNPLYSLVIDPPSLVLQQPGDHAITIPAILARQFDDPCCSLRFFVGYDWLIPLGGPWLSQCPAYTTF